ncbi:calcium-binding protein, partial [Mesorhizobium sp. B263B2A]|uniref:calcium-binding protein n=1 Tax=Mesorhizobium sp. B263B2A TaxID=2876669 RepID=UPI00296201A7
VSTYNGAGTILIGKTVTTTSADGLTITVQSDLDGNGTIDQISTATTILGANGSETDTVTVFNANNAQIAKYQTIISGDGKTVTSTRDVNGNGTIDDSSSIVRNADGSTTTVNRTYAVGILTSSATRTVSANGLSSTLATDLDGNGTIDQSTTNVIVLNADGSKAETITDLDAAGIAKNRTVVVTSANGLTKTTNWAAVDTTISRSKVDTTVLNADGSTAETVDYKKANGSLESRTVTSVSANKLTTTVTKDVNGDGAIDLTTTTVTAADGSVTTTTTGPDTTANALGTGAYTTAPSSTSKTTTVSANGLNSTTLNGATSVDYLPDLPDKRTTETTIGADGNTVQILKAYHSATLSEQTKTTTAGDGLSTTREWDLNGDGTYDRKETDVTAVNANGSTAHTVNKFEGANQTSSFVTTTSANGLSVTTSLDLLGTNPLSQESTDVTTVNTDGSTTRTVTNYKADGSQLSKFITTIPSDGRVVTTQEDIDGVAGIDRVTIDDTRRLADGSVLETIKRTIPSGTLLDCTTKTTSSDGRLISISRDADGNGTVDQTVVTTKAVDGSVTTVITDFSAANHKSSTTKISTSADGLSTTTEWDFDANGTVDQTRRINATNLGNGITETKSRDGMGPSDTFLDKSTTYTSDDGRSSWTGVDYNASSGGFDNTDSIITKADGSTVEGIHNSNRDAAHLAPGVIYWKSAIPGNVIIKTSADGLTTNSWYDYDSNGTDPVNLADTSVSNYEVTAVSQVQIDGSVATTIIEKNSSGAVIAKGAITTSADGFTTTLLKDAENNGTYEHRETAVKHIDGSVRKVVTETNTSGAVIQTATTDVSADGKSVHSVTTDGSNHRTEDFLVKADGTAVQITFVGADEAVRSVHTIDKDGKLTGGTIYDPKNTDPWTRVEQSYTGGTKTLEKQFMDNGTRAEFVFDAVSGQQLSDMTFDAANRVIATETYSSGIIASAVLYDPGNANPWTRVEQSYTGGKETLEKLFMDNGTRVEITFDATGRQLTSTTFDAANAQSWAFIQISYNTAGQQISEIDKFDNGTRAELTYDGPTQYVMGIKRFNAGGALTQTLNADQAEAEFAYDALQNFDLPYYLQANPDVAQNWHNGSAERHFMMYGWKEGRLPKAGYLMPARHTLDLSRTFPNIFNPPSTGGGGGGGNGDSHGRGPVALDLNGDGQVELNQLASTPDGLAPHFDWAGTGTPQQTSWVGSGDGFLAIDLAADGSVGADGIINQAKELQFNLWFANGAAAVSDLDGLRLAFDSNGDDQLDSQDARWGEFRVFQDANQNGVSDAGELKTLSEAGITRIGLVSDPEAAVQYNDGSEMVGTSWYETIDQTRHLVGDITLVSRFDETMVGSTGNDLYQFGAGDGAASIIESGTSNDNDELDFGGGIDWNELWLSQQDNNLVVSVLGTSDKVTVSGWFANPGNIVETIKSGDGKVLHSSDVATLVAAMAGFDPATSPTGSGIQPNDARLGDPNQTGTIAAAMQQTWMAA